MFKTFHPHPCARFSPKSLVEWVSVVTFWCPHARTASHSSFMSSSQTLTWDFLIDKWKSVPPCDVSEPPGGRAGSAPRFADRLHWPVSVSCFWFPGGPPDSLLCITQCSAAAARIPHVPWQWSERCHDACSSLFLSFQQCLALLCRLRRCLMPAPAAPSFCAHAVSSLAVWFSPASQPLLPLFLSLAPHKDLLARCRCRLEALEPDRGEASSPRSYNGVHARVCGGSVKQGGEIREIVFRTQTRWALFVRSLFLLRWSWNQWQEPKK